MAVVRQPHREGRKILMRKYSRLTVAIGAVAASVTLLAACSGSSGKKASSSGAATGSSSSSSSSGTGGGTTAPAYNAAFGSVLNPSTKTGGTLQLGATSDCDSWDPGR